MGKSKPIAEFERSGRKVVLLTLREAEALLSVIPRSLVFEDTDAGRAKRVLKNQVDWLRAQPEEQLA